ncbi:MAG: single-stranded DNA-binding protein [Planctomycetes bacterium]|nr:single-stranded DNA-binding protein [Planctomycetota bacterium]
MSNLNKVFLMGRLTRDPELRYTPKGTPVSEIGLAVNREYTVGTERRKETTFVDITLWSRQAEIVCQYLRKGAPLFVEGRLALDSWEQEGQKRSKLRVVAESFQFLGGPRSETGGGAGGEGASSGGPEEDSSGFPARPPFGGRASPPAREQFSSRPAPGAAPEGISGPPGAGPSRPPSPEEALEAPGDGPLGLGDSDIPF